MKKGGTDKSNDGYSHAFLWISIQRNILKSFEGGYKIMNSPAENRGSISRWITKSKK